MRNDTIFILSQLIGLIAFFFSLLAYHQKQKRTILSCMVLSNALNLVHYFLLGALSGAITKIIAIFRDLFVIAKEKYKILNIPIYLYLFLLIYLVMGILTFEHIWSIFPMLAAIIYIIGIWNGKEKTVKLCAFFCYFLWLFYNIFVFSLAGILTNVISLLSLFLALKRKEDTHEL